MPTRTLEGRALHMLREVTINTSPPGRRNSSAEPAWRLIRRAVRELNPPSRTLPNDDLPRDRSVTPLRPVTTAPTVGGAAPVASYTWHSDGHSRGLVHAQEAVPEVIDLARRATGLEHVAGVVDLIDEGRLSELRVSQRAAPGQPPMIALQTPTATYISGHPFPGQDERLSPRLRLRSAAQLLLETLARVHMAGLRLGTCTSEDIQVAGGIPRVSTLWLLESTEHLTADLRAYARLVLDAAYQLGNDGKAIFPDGFHQALEGLVRGEPTATSALDLLRAWGLSPEPLPPRRSDATVYVTTTSDRPLGSVSDWLCTLTPDLPLTDQLLLLRERGDVVEVPADVALDTLSACLLGAEPTGRVLDADGLAEIFADLPLIAARSTAAARELMRRTAGRPRQVLAELDAWVRLGWAQWKQGRLVIEAPTIHRLAFSAQSAAFLPMPHPELLTPDQQRAHALLQVCAPYATTSLYARLWGAQNWEEVLFSLVRAGVCARTPEDNLVLLHPSELLASHAETASWAWREQMHVLASSHFSALKDATPESLLSTEATRREFAAIHHLYHTDATYAAVRRSRALARTLLFREAPREAFPLLMRALLLSQITGGGGGTGLLRDLVVVALELMDVALLRVLDDLFTRAPNAPILELRLQRLVRAALRLQADEAAESYLHLSEVGPLFGPDLELERWRFHLLFKAGSRGPHGAEARRRTMQEAKRWLVSIPRDARDYERYALHVKVWETEHLYHTHQYAKAASRWVWAIETAALPPTTKLNMLGNAAQTWLLARETEQARMLALDAIETSRMYGLERHEVRAIRILRACDAQEGTPVEVRHDILELIRSFDAAPERNLLAVAALTEAAVAWRRGAGDLTQAGALARVALESTRTGHALRWVCLALSAACGQPATDSELDAATQQMEEHGRDEPLLAAQGLALLLLTPGRARPSTRRSLQRLMRSRPCTTGHLDRPMEVLSLRDIACILESGQLGRNGPH